MHSRNPPCDEAEGKILLQAYRALGRIDDPSPRIKAVKAAISKVLTTSGLNVDSRKSRRTPVPAGDAGGQ